MTHVTLWARTIPAGAYGPDQGFPILPKRVRRMSRRRQKKWLARVVADAIRSGA